MSHLPRLRLASRWQSVTDAYRRRLLRARIKDRKFTVISNNCWGSHLYQELGIPYLTPTIGLFFAPSCFIKLAGGLRSYLKADVKFITRSSNDFINHFRETQKTNYPIGLIDDVEIQFLHYHTEAEAADTWKRRAARVVDRDDRIYFKFDDRGGCTADELIAFERLTVPNKVCFVSKPIPGLNQAIVVPTEGPDGVPDGVTLSKMSPNYFDAAGWINGTGTRPAAWPLRCG